MLRKTLLMSVAALFITTTMARADDGTCCQTRYKLVEYTVMVPTWITEKQTVQVTKYKNENRTRTYTVQEAREKTEMRTRTYCVYERENRSREETYSVCKPV